MPTETKHIDEAQNAPLNRDIERFLMTSEFLEIDFEYGFQQMNMYLQDTMFRAHGASYSELGIDERRRAKAASILVPSDAASNGYLVDAWDIKNGMIAPGSIALLKLSGVMRTESALSSPGIDRLAADLRSAYNNPNIKGAIIETTSGGGESMAGNVLKSALSEKNKPTVVWAHLIASAAYRAGTGADEIILSSDQAEAGSIGTMISMHTKTLEAMRKHYSDFYGTDAPKKNDEFRRALVGDFSAIQARVDEMTRQFHNEIKRDRNLQGDAEQIKETLSGAMFTGVDAKRRGLVDAIGNLNFAIRRVNALQSMY